MKQKENIVEQVRLKEFKHLRFEIEKEEYMVTLVDAENYKIIRGYGNSIIEAINDLHHNLI